MLAFHRRALSIYRPLLCMLFAVLLVFFTTQPGAALAFDTPLLSLLASNSSPATTGTPVVFTAIATPGSNAQLSWNFGDGATGNGAVVSHAYASPGSYSAVVTATNSLGSLVARTPVVISAAPIAIAGLSINVGTPAVVQQPVQFTSIITAGTSAQFTWNFGDGATASGAAATHSYAAAGTYTASVTVSNTLNTLSASVPVVVQAGDIPITSLTASTSGAATVGKPIALSASVGSGTSISYTWSFGDGTTGSGAVAAHTYAAPGIYSAIVTATNALGSLVASTPVVVTAAEVQLGGVTVSTTSPATPGDPIRFNADVISGTNVQFAWNFGDGASSVGAEVTHSYATPGTYTATLTATNPLGALALTTQVVVLATDVPLLGLTASNSGPATVGTPVSLSASLSGGSGAELSWNFGDGTTGSGATTGHIYTAPGTYNAVVTATNALGSLVATTPVVITAANTAIGGLTASNTSPTTPGSPLSFNASVISGTNVVFQWDFGDGATGVGAQVNHPYVTAGTYTATVTATNALGSVATTTPVVIVANELPPAGLSANNTSPATSGSVIGFSASVASGTNVQFQWNFGDGTSGSGATTAHAYSGPGTYTATVTATNSAGSQATSTTVTVLATATPISGLKASSTSPATPGADVRYTATISGGSDVQYRWSFGDGATGSGASVVHRYSQAGTYTATVTATNSLGSTTASTEVQVVAAQPKRTLLRLPIIVR